MDASIREAEDRLVVTALREVGVEAASVYDLVNDRRSLRRAVAPLLRLLPQLTDPAIKEGVVRALTDRAARGVAAKPLLEELRRVRDSGDEILGWTIGNALKVVADDSVFEEICEFVRDRALGRARQTVVESLAQMKDPRAVGVLIELLQDDEVTGHAIVALRKLRANEARDHIALFIDHPKAWVRREAKKALSALA